MNKKPYATLDVCLHSVVVSPFPFEVFLMQQRRPSSSCLIALWRTGFFQLSKMATTCRIVLRRNCKAKQSRDGMCVIPNSSSSGIATVKVPHPMYPLDTLNVSSVIFGRNWLLQKKLHTKHIQCRQLKIESKPNPEKFLLRLPPLLRNTLEPRF